MKRIVLLLGAALAFLVGPAGARAATQAEIDAAIQKALGWLATQQHPTTGSFGGGYLLANTAAAVLAFENEGHFPGSGSAYAANVEKGLDYVFQSCRKVAISAQPAGNPDTNGNGQGIRFPQSSEMYEIGLVVPAIVASNAPDRVVSGGACAGMTYRDVVIDAVDYVSWAQGDYGSGRGGWDYAPNSARADNSISQWPVLALVVAAQWGIHAPAFVKAELEKWVTFIQSPTSGGSGYQYPTDGYVNESKTGGLLVEFYYLGDDRTSARATAALGYLDRTWNNPLSGTWFGNKGNPYAMYSIFKGLELMRVPAIPNAPANAETPAGDWWGDYAEYLVNTQNQASGYWFGDLWGIHLATPWYVSILQASIFPVSVQVSVPGAACDLTGYRVEVRYKVERFTASGTLSVYRDGVLYDAIPLTDFIGEATAAYDVAPEPAGAHDWRAALDVTGGGVTAHAEDTAASTVHETPQVGGIPDQVAPFVPIRLDDYQSCEVQDAVWTVTGVPVGWTVTIDAENVATVIPPAGAYEPAAITFHATFTWNGIECTGSQTVTFSPNLPPVADAGRTYPFEKYEVEEGGWLTLDGTGSYDPDGVILSWAWDLDGDGTFETDGATPTFQVTMDGREHAEFYVYLRVCDDHGACGEGLAEVEVANVPPAVGPISVVSVVMAGTPLAASAGFTDPGTMDAHTAVWDWGDAASPGEVTEANGSGSVTGTHVYAAAGVHTVTLTVTDDDGGAGTSTFQYVAVFDPSAGFVTGGGWIDSPPGAMPADPLAAGRASFGFVSQYKKGATVPTGNANFRFHAGALSFHSTSFDWLVVTGSSYARFKGWGTIDGAGPYRFMIWARDAAPDTFRIRIWSEDASGIELVVYDNGVEQAIAAGSIVVHD